MSTSQSSGSKHRLTVAMIVRDAAAALAETLHSVQGIADQIVVLDTGSTDDTKSVAQAFSVVLIEQQWSDDFAAARNHCLAHVDGDWVLWLDAGESMSDDSARQLREFVDEKADASRAYMLLVRVAQSDTNISAEQIGRVRLVPNLPGIRFRGRIRETLDDSLNEQEITLEGLAWRLHRGPREHNPEVKVRKARRDLRIAEKQIREGNATPDVLCCVGEALHMLGDVNGALESFRQAIGLAKPATTEMLEAYYGLLTALDDQQDARKDQLAVCLQAVEAFPLDAQLLCAMGGYLQGEGRIDLALRSYQTAYQHGRIHPHAWHLEDMAEVAAVCYSLSLQVQGDDEKAREVLEEAVKSQPGSNRLRRHLIDLYVKASRRDDALAQLDQLPGEIPGVEALRSAVRGACLAAEKNWIPAHAYLQAAYEAGCRDLLCLRWLSIVLLAKGETEAVRPILKQWSELDPANAEVQQYLAATTEAPQSDAEPDPQSKSGSIRFDRPQTPHTQDIRHSRPTQQPQASPPTAPPPA